MARLSTGPLVAGLSGKLGPVVFYQTKFGQVAASRAKPRIYTTPAALETKSTFGLASRMWNRSPKHIQLRYNLLADRTGKVGSGIIISSLMRLIREGAPGPTPGHGGLSPVALGTPFFSGGRWRIPYTDPNFTLPPRNGQAWSLGPATEILTSTPAFTSGGNFILSPQCLPPFYFFTTSQEYFEPSDPPDIGSQHATASGLYKP